jgi:hypothetical protein
MRFWESWLRKKLGITPEILARARQDERTAGACARALPFAVNRQVLILLPRDRFFAWKTQWDSMRAKGSPERADLPPDRWLYARAYLVSGIHGQKKLAAFVHEHRKYFLDSFVEGHSPKQLWPWVPSEDEFPEWFETRLVGWGPWDLVDGPLSKEPDLLAAGFGGFESGDTSAW